MISERRAAYCTLTVFTVLVVLQMVVHHEYGEPYPSLSMPTFRGGGVATDADVLVGGEVKFFLRLADGTELPLAATALFGVGMPEQTRAVVAGTLYAPERWRPLSESGNRREDQGGLFPGRAVLWQHVFDDAAAYRSVPWLRSRIRSIYPDENVDAFIVRWYETRFAMGRKDRSLAYEGMIPLQQQGSRS